MIKRSKDEKLDQAMEDSFPASDPPATVGIVGPRAAPVNQAAPRQTPHKRDADARPTGTPIQKERHTMATANHPEDRIAPTKR
jgi:hypothetical protein